MCRTILVALLAIAIGLLQRIAVPMIGGMVSSTVLTLVVISAIYAAIKGIPLRAARVALQQAPAE